MKTDLVRKGLVKGGRKKEKQEYENGTWACVVRKKRNEEKSQPGLYVKGLRTEVEKKKK